MRVVVAHAQPVSAALAVPRAAAGSGIVLVVVTVKTFAAPLVSATGTVVVMMVCLVAGSRHAPNQPHLRHGVTELVRVSVVNPFAAPLVAVTGIVVVIVALVVAGSRHAPNQPHRRHVVTDVVRVSVVRACVEDVVVLSS